MSNFKYPISNKRKKSRRAGKGYVLESRSGTGRGSKRSEVRTAGLRAAGPLIKEKIETSGIWLDFSPVIKKYWSKTDHKQSKIIWSALVLMIPLVFFMTVAQSSNNDEPLASPQITSPECIWEICAIDTMKTSRDMARDNLNNQDYDQDIITQLRAIKDTGAGFVSITTPYDEEFRPYLLRWVTLARREGLKVWFRGNWAEWEGWFGYPKNMTPDQHLAKNSQFIAENADLFKDGDIFDPCPECENAYFWPQNDKNRDYREFVLRQQKQTENDFRQINKIVAVHQSVIGGRAKDVLDQQTFDGLGNRIAIDHYVPKKEGMKEFIDYFKNLRTRSLVSEFGAPIPDMNGPMNEKQQAEFVRDILEVLYQNRDSVEGLNYWVLSHGTTALLNPDYSRRAVYDEVRKYFSPARVEGRVVNPLGEGIKNITVKTSDNATRVKTDNQGYFNFSIPPRQFELVLDDPDYPMKPTILEASESGQVISYTFTAEPKNPGVIYNLKRFWQNLVD